MCGGLFTGRSMADIFASDRKDHVLGDIGRMISDTLQVAGDQDQIESALDRAGIRDHIGDQLAEDLVLVSIDAVVAIENLTGQFDVSPNQRVERLANYLITQKLRQGGHDTFTLPHEKRVLASLMGMTPENLSRALATLADYGVAVDGPQVTIARPVVLERLAKPTPLIDNHMPLLDGLTGKAQREREPMPTPAEVLAEVERRHLQDDRREVGAQDLRIREAGPGFEVGL